ncbi:MAG: oligopeptide transporter, OPT family [Myxococcota bacterium]
MNEPATTPTVPVPELTVRAVILALILSVVMGAANVYLGLKVGLTVSASIPAAVVGMLILRGLFRDGTILEANQVQTGASAGESLAAGVIFTMPALILIGVWESFDFITTTVVAFTGGLLGILFMIPMRRVFVVADREELRFPEGVACAEVLKSGDQKSDSKGAAAVAWGAGVGALIKALSSVVLLLRGGLETAYDYGGRLFFFGSDMSPALVAVGFIVRLNVALLIFIGGALTWLVAMPFFVVDDVHNPVEAAGALWSAKLRFIGVGAMVMGGIQSIFKVRHGLVEAVQKLRGAKAEADGAEDLPGPAIVGFSLLAVALITGVYLALTKSLVIALITTVIMVAMSFFFTAVASYIVGLVGNSNSPVSGMTITAVLFTGALMLVFGFSGTEGMVATLGVAAIVCCAACTSGDVCNDLKTGQLVGATPRRQQMMQIGGVFVGSLVMAPVLQLLHSNTPGGIGGKELAAPQAGLFAGLTKGFFGDGEPLPWDMIAIGVATAVVIMVADYVLEQRRSGFRLHLMPLAVGMYLPFGIAPPILAGGLMAHYLAAGEKDEQADRRLLRGVLFASGIIAGESLTGVGLALYRSMNLNTINLQLPDMVAGPLTLAAGAGVLYLFWSFTKAGIRDQT